MAKLIADQTQGLPPQACRLPDGPQARPGTGRGRPGDEPLAGEPARGAQRLSGAPSRRRRAAAWSRASMTRGSLYGASRRRRCAVRSSSEAGPDSSTIA